jgi:YQGE family putative transporter
MLQMLSERFYARFIVTAPAMLMMKFFALEGAALGTAQPVGSHAAAVIMLILGKLSKPKQRLVILVLTHLFLLALFNSLMFNPPKGPIIFLLLICETYL